MLGIVVVNYGSHALIEANLASLQLDPSETHVVVVDNFHSLREREAVRVGASAQRWALVELPENVGYGAANNVGVNVALEAGSDAVMILNPDVRLDEAAIAGLLDEALSKPSSVVSPTIVRPDGQLWFAGGQLDLRTGTTTTTGTAVGDLHWLSGACLVMSSQLWRRLGGFHPTYFMYWEDIELSARCRQLGAELLVHPGITVVHDVGGTQAGTGKSNLYFYYNCRNRLVFGSRWVDRRRLLRWIINSPSVGWRILSRGGRRRLLRRPMTVVFATVGTISGVSRAVASILRPGENIPRRELWGADT